MRRVPYPPFPVGVEADEVVDGGDGVDEDEVDAHEHQQPRHRPRSVRHLAPSFPSPPQDEGRLVDEREQLKHPHEARAMAARGGRDGGRGQSDYQSLPQTSDPTATGVPPSSSSSKLLHLPIETKFQTARLNGP